MTRNPNGRRVAWTGWMTHALAMVAWWAPAGSGSLRAADHSDGVPQHPQAVSTVELSQHAITGVSAVEVNDYAPGGYQGPLTPSPPHADGNPRRAIIVLWENHAHRFVFSHEASYCPLLELPNGAAMCNQPASRI